MSDESEYSEPKLSDLRKVLVPVNIRLPGQQLAIIKEFARRKNVDYEALIQEWCEDRIRVEAQKFLAEHSTTKDR